MDGHTTTAALCILQRALHECIVNHERKLRCRTWSEKFSQSFLHHDSQTSVLRWPSILILLLVAVALLAAYIAQPDRQHWLLVEVFVICAMLALNLYLLSWDDTLRSCEHIERARRALDKLKDSVELGAWKPDRYSDLNCPLSPCISLQWTIRDGQLVNLPVCFLVIGDVILLRPGQVIPARCQQSCDDGHKGIIYDGGDVFNPTIEHTDIFSRPQAQQPAKPQFCTMLETPFIHNFNMMLESSHIRPISVLDRQKYQVCTVWMERRVLPALLVVTLIVNVVRYVILTQHIGHWSEMFLSLPAHTLLPVIPIVFPWLWTLLDAYGMARFMLLFNRLKNGQELKEADDPTVEDDLESSIFPMEVDSEWYDGSGWREIWSEFRDVLSGRSNTLVRTANVVHTLGNVTSFCCVDKKGVLSWPNPTAEKVFFLRNRCHEPSNPGSHSSQNISAADEMGVTMETMQDGCSMGSANQEPMPDSEPALDSTIEVLDLTQDAKNGYGLQFDDPSWKKYDSSLRPLGLNILLNTCNMGTAEKYTEFADHVTCASLKCEGSVPVVNRRCFCELSRQIGFDEHATSIFKLQHQLAMYRHLPPELNTGTHKQPAKTSVKYRMPLPNMFSVVVEELHSPGSQQLFSQGTADLLLDTCTDFWDGYDLCPLTDADRKKIADFYHRTSMSSYCTAFSYRPVNQTLSPQLNDVYIEVPPNMPGHFPMNFSPLSRSLDSQSVDSLTAMKFFCSVDSLLAGGSTGVVSDADSCVRLQSRQVFIGMITMQYQAKQDMVKLIDELELACIRFAHFSKENELRSRVFSEKMGLEAGWNCHISLLSDSVHSQEPRSRSSSRGSCVSALSHRGARGRSRHQFLSHVRPPPAYHSSAPGLIDYDCNHITTGVHQVQEEAALLHRDSQDEAVDAEEVASIDGGYAPSSHITENTDSMIGGLGFSNRAKLPKGIENVRPHLEDIDNVPLLVSLFTDCTPATTREMLKVLQEYGEVVCCLGSAVNIDNTGVFLQADCSLAVQPLYPQMCTRRKSTSCSGALSPLSISAELQSIPCSLAFHRDDPVKFIRLIVAARHHCQCMRATFTFLLTCELATSMLLLAGSCLPPPLAHAHVLWLGFVALPALSATLMHGAFDPDNLGRMALGKNRDHVTMTTVLQYVASNAVRHGPSVIVCLVCHALILSSCCHKMADNPDSCHWFLGDCGYALPDQSWNGWSTKYKAGLFVSQNFVASQMLLYFVCTSLCSVHQLHHLWQRSPFSHRLWCKVMAILVFLQVTFFVLSTCVANTSEFRLSDIPVAAWVIALAWPILLIPLLELMKRTEIKSSVRYQKRARLDFGTKLGMNSPF